MYDLCWIQNVLKGCGCGQGSVGEGVNKGYMPHYFNIPVNIEDKRTEWLMDGWTKWQTD